MSIFLTFFFSTRRLVCLHFYARKCECLKGPQLGTDKEVISSLVWFLETPPVWWLLAERLISFAIISFDLEGCKRKHFRLGAIEWPMVHVLAKYVILNRTISRKKLFCWQRRWLEEVGFKNRMVTHWKENYVHCLEDRSLSKNRVVGYVQKYSHQH